MDTDKIAQIALELQALKQEGMPFAAARQKLIEKGYNENEIALTVANNNPYREKVVDDSMQGVKDYFRQNPQAAEKVGGSIAQSVVESHSEIEKIETIGAVAGATLPGAWGAKHISKLFTLLGWPYFVLVVLQVGAVLFAPADNWGIVNLAVIGLTVIYLILHFLVFRKKK